MSINSEAQKDQAQLEKEIAEQRAHLGETIEALEQRFSPGQILDQVLNYSKENGSEFSQNLVGTIKNNPVPTLLTAIGIAWMMFGRKDHNEVSYQSSQFYNAGNFGPDYDEPVNASYGVDADYDTSLKEAKHNVTDELKSKVGQVKAKAEHAKEQVKDQLKDSLRSARDTGHELQHKVEHAGKELRHQAHKASDNLQQFLKDQPLALGAAGVAIGAILGGLFPASRIEDQLMGQKRDEVLDKAKQASGEITQRVENVGKKVAADAKQEAKEAFSSYQHSAENPFGSDSRYSNNPPKLN